MKYVLTVVNLCVVSLAVADFTQHNTDLIGWNAGLLNKRFSDEQPLTRQNFRLQRRGPKRPPGPSLSRSNSLSSTSSGSSEYHSASSGKSTPSSNSRESSPQRGRPGPSSGPSSSADSGQGRAGPSSPGASTSRGRYGSSGASSSGRLSSGNIPLLTGPPSPSRSSTSPRFGPTSPRTPTNPDRPQGDHNNPVGASATLEGAGMIGVNDPHGIRQNYLVPPKVQQTIASDNKQQPLASAQSLNQGEAREPNRRWPVKARGHGSTVSAVIQAPPRGSAHALLTAPDLPPKQIHVKDGNVGTAVMASGIVGGAKGFAMSGKHGGAAINALPWNIDPDRVHDDAGMRERFDRLRLERGV